MAIRAPPLDAATARQMVEEIRGRRSCEGACWHVPPRTRRRLADAIVRLGQLAADHRDHLVPGPESRRWGCPSRKGVTAVDWLIQFDDAE